MRFGTSFELSGQAQGQYLHDFPIQLVHAPVGATAPHVPNTENVPYTSPDDSARFTFDLVGEYPYAFNAAWFALVDGGSAGVRYSPPVDVYVLPELGLVVKPERRTVLFVATVTGPKGIQPNARTVYFYNRRVGGPRRARLIGHAPLRNVGLARILVAELRIPARPGRFQAGWCTRANPAQNMGVPGQSFPACGRRTLRL